MPVACVIMINFWSIYQPHPKIRKPRVPCIRCGARSLVTLTQASRVVCSSLASITPSSPPSPAYLQPTCTPRTTPHTFNPSPHTTKPYQHHTTPPTTGARATNTPK